ncbi:zinc-ribbon domain-containing protein [Lentisalinibacter salinarum]|uniref:zinc-ribbon domain-containing protein n=1 Tax=Lentisalinibacter salinarum TaxID=2992239 RepID=UPI0038639F1A
MRIYTELEPIFPSVEHRTLVEGFEVDVYIPELKIGVEYDGVYWHDDKIEKDKEKNIALEPSILLIRIREDGLPLLSLYDIQVEKRKLSILTIKQLLKVIREHRELPDETITQIHAYLRRTSWGANDMFKRLYSERKFVQYQESLSHLFPELAREWHPTRNDGLWPDQFTPGSGRIVWWLGQCGHEWQDTINHRKGGRDCPECRYTKASATRRKNRARGQLPLFD